MSAPTLNLADLLSGTRLALTDGRIVQVVDNPRDGTWLVCRTLDDTAEDELVSAGDISGLA